MYKVRKPQVQTGWICRQDAIDLLKVYTEKNNLGHTPLQIVEHLPSAEPEIIRCKDCLNADFSGTPKGRCYCMEHGSYWDEDDFCSYGEKENRNESMVRVR